MPEGEPAATVEEVKAPSTVRRGAPPSVTTIWRELRGLARTARPGPPWPRVSSCTGKWNDAAPIRSSRTTTPWLMISVSVSPSWARPSPFSSLNTAPTIYGGSRFSAWISA
ncbi:MAG: hypothetical protein BWZ10_01926 [candidate division BRC1 bacterium ADurb.BinA364]|nr:MAG: hypothetical protein BWZ10_01926 [candidate division BRC1 bacterium ADurb.BinA364]